MTLYSIPIRHHPFESLPSISKEAYFNQNETGLDYIGVDEEYIKIIDSKDSQNYYDTQYYINEGNLKILIGKNPDRNTEYQLDYFCNLNDIAVNCAKVQFANLKRIYAFLDSCQFSYPQAIIFLSSVFGMPSKTARVYVLSFFMYLFKWQCKGDNPLSSPQLYMYVAEQYICAMEWFYSQRQSFFRKFNDLDVIAGKFEDKTQVNFLVKLICDELSVPDDKHPIVQTLLKTLLRLYKMPDKFLDVIFDVIAPCFGADPSLSDTQNVFDIIKFHIVNVTQLHDIDGVLNNYFAIFIVPVKVSLGVLTHNGKTINLLAKSLPSNPI